MAPSPKEEIIIPQTDSWRRQSGDLLQIHLDSSLSLMVVPLCAKGPTWLVLPTAWNVDAKGIRMRLTRWQAPDRAALKEHAVRGHREDLVAVQDRTGELAPAIVNRHVLKLKKTLPTSILLDPPFDAPCLYSRQI